MYFFDLKGLIQRLSQKPLSSIESLHYFFAYICLNSVMRLPDIVAPKTAKESTAPTIVAAVLIMIVVLFIVWLVLRRFYNANGGEAGENFLTNLLAVGWVVSLRTLAILIPFALVIFWLISASPPGGAVLSMALIALIFGALGGLYWALSSISGALAKIHEGRSSAT